MTNSLYHHIIIQPTKTLISVVEISLCKVKVVTEFSSIDAIQYLNINKEYIYLFWHKSTGPLCCYMPKDYYKSFMKTLPKLQDISKYETRG